MVVWLNNVLSISHCPDAPGQPIYRAFIHSQIAISWRLQRTFRWMDFHRRLFRMQPRSAMQVNIIGWSSLPSLWEVSSHWVPVPSDKCSWSLLPGENPPQMQRDQWYYLDGLLWMFLEFEWWPSKWNPRVRFQIDQAWFHWCHSQSDRKYCLNCDKLLYPTCDKRKLTDDILELDITRGPLNSHLRRYWNLSSVPKRYKAVLNQRKWMRKGFIL